MADVDNIDSPSTWSGAIRSLKAGKESDLGIDDPNAPTAPSGKADPLKYLGHFANDDVINDGHNRGFKPKAPKNASTPNAKAGYRKIPGTGANQIGHAKYGEADTGLRDRKQRDADEAMNKASAAKMHLVAPWAAIPLARPFGAPRAVSDVKMSIQHHQDSIANDTKHLQDHKASIKRHKAEMKIRTRQLRKPVK